jgi:hypothetical protein
VLGADQTLTLGAKRFSSSESRVARVQRQVREPFLMSNGEITSACAWSSAMRAYALSISIDERAS